MAILFFRRHWVLTVASYPAVLLKVNLVVVVEGLIAYFNLIQHQPMAGILFENAHDEFD
jgi:hypothetical protein